MNSRGLPFQFRSIDPAKRQAELEKRFGLPTSCEKKMHLDLGNPNWMDMKKDPHSASSSPRLQHRVPVFVENMQKPTQSAADSNPTNVDGGQKPRVRVVPIEVETGDSPSRRSKTLSANHGFGVNNRGVKDPWFEMYEPRVEMEPPVFGPRVCNIPVKVEGSLQNGKPKSPATVKKIPVKKEQVVKTIPVQREVPKPVQPNGCNASKKSKPVQEQVPTSPHGVSLQKIAVVLDKLKGYQAEVENFSGTSKEKQYRYLDEMLTRLMLDLDNIETMGNEEVRLARKEAIRKVQHCIDLLETKVCDKTEVNSSQDPSKEMAVESELGHTEASEMAQGEMMEADVEAEQTMETESQPETGPVSDSGKVGEQVEEGLKDIKVTEVEAEGDEVNAETEVEPVVSEDSNTSDELVNESLVKDPEVKTTELEGETSDTQGMDIDEERSLENVVTELEKDSVRVELDSETIPEINNINSEHDNQFSEKLSGENCNSVTNISHS